MKRKTRLDFYFEKKEISYIRDIINRDNSIEYLNKNNLNLNTYNDYLNDIDIKYNKLIRKNIKKEVDDLLFLYYSIYILLC